MQASEVRNDLTKRTAGCCAIRRLTRMSVCRVSFEPLAVMEPRRCNQTGMHCGLANRPDA